MKSSLTLVVRILSMILIVFLIIRGSRLIGNLFALFARYWFIVIPVLLVIWFYLRTRQKERDRQARRDNLDPDKEIIVDEDKRD